MEELKRCSVCGKSKPLKSFKNTAKTEDHKYPLCKGCEWNHKFYYRRDKHYVMFRLFRELVAKAGEQNVGATELKMNKSLFSLWLYSSRKFLTLYSKYINKNSEDYDDLEFHINIKNKNKLVTFENIEIVLTVGVDEIKPLFDADK